MIHVTPNPPSLSIGRRIFGLGQAILVKAGGYQEKETEVPSLANACQILYKIRWPDGTAAKNLWVNCKDGSRNYNYHTDEKGEVLFSTNSGGANITITNIFGSNTYVLDVVNAGTINIDAPIGTVKRLNYTLSEMPLNRMITMGFSYRGTACIYNNKFTTLGVNMIGGGGGGCGGDSGRSESESGYGGGAGYITSFNLSNKEIGSLQEFSFTIGSGGSYGDGDNKSWADSIYINGDGVGGNGGVTSIFGRTANGGTGGSLTVAGTGSAKGARYNSNYHNNYDLWAYGENSPDSRFGGGGGGYRAFTAEETTGPQPHTGGKPYGGIGGMKWYAANGGYYRASAGSGSNGGGGGAAYCTTGGSDISAGTFHGGYGGAGCIWFTVYR